MPETLGQAQTEQPQMFEVEVGGEKRNVALDDLRKGYMMQEDYTKKTQELASKRKEVDALVEQRATELYLQALNEEKSEAGEGRSKADEGGNDPEKGQNSELLMRLEKLEHSLGETRQ